MKLFITIIFSIIIFSIVLSGRSSWVSNIPNGGVNSCRNCHPNGNTSQINEFGKAAKFYFSNGKVNWGEALALLDSDSDGFTNGTELQDPDGTWRQGNPAPGQSSLVTNPGDASSFPNTSSIHENLKSNEFEIFSIYPNPVISQSNIEIRLLKKAFLKIELIDYSGYLISILYNETFDNGDYLFFISNQIVNYSGQYILRISLNNYTFSKKIVIIK